MIVREICFGTGRRVDEREGIRVSTVFLDAYSFGADSPLLWETMIFGGEHDEYQERYATKAEALEGHKRACALAFGESP